MASTFWLSDICSLTNSININPFVGDDRNFKYNSLTRLIILVTIIALLIPGQNKITIFISGMISLALTYIIYMVTHSSTKKTVELIKDTSRETPTPTHTHTHPHTPTSTSTSTSASASASTPTVEKTSDHAINSANQVTLNYTPANTKLKEGKFFLKPNEMPASVTETTSVVANIDTMNKSVPNNSVKQLHSLLNKNLSFQ